MKITPDFSSEPMQERREGNELFSVKGKRKKKSHQPRRQINVGTALRDLKVKP